MCPFFDCTIPPVNPLMELMHSGAVLMCPFVDCTIPPVNPLVELMPSGAVLMCPFVDCTTKDDLMVNDSVMEEGIPYFATQGDAPDIAEKIGQQCNYAVDNCKKHTHLGHV